MTKSRAAFEIPKRKERTHQPVGKKRYNRTVQEYNAMIDELERLHALLPLFKNILLNNGR